MLTEVHVVLGATRPLGSLVVSKLVGEGKQVRALVLDVPRARAVLPESVEIVQIKPKRTSIEDACQEATVIYNLFEPPNNKQLNVLAEVTTGVLTAAIKDQAKVVLASHLFRSEDDNRMIEEDALSTDQSKFTKVVIARLPQMFGPNVTNALFTHIFEAVVRGNKAHWVGRLDVPRSFVYSEDAASAIMILVKSNTAYGRAWNIAGPSPLTGKQFIELAFRSAEKGENSGVWGRGIMITASIIDPKARRFLEMPYDYYRPFVIDGSSFAQSFHSFTYTPNEIAMAKTLQWYADYLAKRQDKKFVRRPSD